MTSKTSFELAASREIAKSRTRSPHHLGRAASSTTKLTLASIMSQPNQGRVRVFAVPIEPLTADCRALLLHGDRGVEPRVRAAESTGSPG